MPFVPSRIRRIPSLLRSSYNDDPVSSEHLIAKALPTVPGRGHGPIGSPRSANSSNGSGSDCETIHAEQGSPAARARSLSDPDFALEQTYPLVPLDLAPLDLCYDIDSAALANEMALSVLDDPYEDELTSALSLDRRESKARRARLSTVAERDESCCSRRHTQEPASTSFGQRIFRGLPLRPSYLPLSPRSRRMRHRRRSLRQYRVLNDSISLQKTDSSSSKAASNSPTRQRVKHSSSQEPSTNRGSSRRKPRVADVACPADGHKVDPCKPDPAASRLATAFRAMCSLRRAASGARRARNPTPRNGTVPVAHAPASEAARLFPSWSTFGAAAWDDEPAPSSRRRRSAAYAGYDLPYTRFSDWASSTASANA